MWPGFGIFLFLEGGVRQERSRVPVTVFAGGERVTK